MASLQKNTLMDAPDVLKKIAAYKADEVKALKKRTNIKELRAYAARQTAPRGFAAALERAAITGPALIAEVKKASPSKGIIRADFDPVNIALSYEVGGAACLSVLTDGPGFQGSNQIFGQVRKASPLPLPRATKHLRRRWARWLCCAHCRAPLCRPWRWGGVSGCGSG